MTGKTFIRFIAKRGIPLSCLASRLDCKLDTLRALNNSEEVPKHYIKRFIASYKDTLSQRELAFLRQ